MDNFDVMALYNGSVLTISILVFFLGIVAVKSARSSAARLFIVFFTAFVYVAIMLGPVQLLSYAKPTTMEWVNRNVNEAEVLHAEIRENDGIYLLLDWYGVPRYYKMVWNAELAQQLIDAMEQAREEAGGGDRAGARSQEQEQQDQQNEPIGEQSGLDQALGPMGEQGDGEQQGALTEEQLRQGMGREQGEGQGQGQGQGQGENEGGEGQDQGQGQGQQGQSQGGGRGEMHNSGNGRVMMRFPFKGGKTEGDGESEEGSITGMGEEDTRSEAMFYPMPQPRYPTKQVPTDN